MQRVVAFSNCEKNDQMKIYRKFIELWAGVIYPSISIILFYVDKSVFCQFLHKFSVPFNYDKVHSVTMQNWQNNAISTHCYFPLSLNDNNIIPRNIQKH